MTTTYDTDAIRRQFSINDLVSGLKQRGHWSSGACPKCGGKDRFTTKNHGAAFLCRQCYRDGSTYGDVIDFAMWLNDVSFVEACEWLLGNPAPANPSPSRPGPKREQKFYTYAYNLNWQQPEADVVAAWQNYKPLTRETILSNRLGLGRIPFSATEHDRLLVPIFAYNGDLLMVRGRAIHAGDTEAKWMSSGGWDYSRLPLYNWQSIRTGDVLIICENPVDAVMVSASGDFPTVATLTSTYWLPEWTDRIVEARPSVVLLAGDQGDAPVIMRDGTVVRAGEKMNERIGRELTAAGVNCKPFPFPEGQWDLGSWWQQKIGTKVL